MRWQRARHREHGALLWVQVGPPVVTQVMGREGTDEAMAYPVNLMTAEGGQCRVDTRDVELLAEFAEVVPWERFESWQERWRGPDA